ncbi:MAG: type II toxin-antitoxin system Phd/YefM family antitoxin [Proteobacteria bacterium]|nr:type II toxin-antitoxin system Phd/YefM family antitoxin [Pseudomonadota bacterium]MBU1738953.1 type II toxin-antitoxin system Phd/YefM family antitoxin [Pseudomonadota bacterium]
MKPIHVSEDIVSLSDFKNHASKMLRKVQTTHRPMIITQNGTPAGVIISPAEFDAFTEKNRFLEAINCGLADVKEGRVLTDKELDKALDGTPVD